MTGAEPADSPSPDPSPAADPTPTPDPSPAAEAPTVAGAAPSEPTVAAANPGRTAAPPPPTGSNQTTIVAAVVGGAVVLLLVACLGLVGGIFLLRGDDTTASGPETTAPVRPRSSGGGGPTASIPAEEPVVQGPQASAYPAEKIEDLNRVCDEDIYYPELPKRAGKAPHPVVLLLSDTPGLRYKDDGYYYDLGLSKKVEQTWASEDPRSVQMVACLDRVSAGSTIRTCKFDDPKPQTLTLVRTSWRLRVYEAATGRKLLEKTMPGDDQKCPYVVMVGADKKIYAEVSDRAAIAALRNLVTK